MNTDSIEITSIVSLKDGLPYVQLHWAPLSEGCQMTPEETREHATRLLAAAEAAESDSLVIRFLKETVKIPHDKAVAVLADFRKYRADLLNRHKSADN